MPRHLSPRRPSDQMATTHVDQSLDRSLIQLYRQLRNEMFNRDYYGCLLHRRRRLDRIFQFTIAFGSSSAIGGWAIFGQGGGEMVWAIIAGLTAVVAIAQPILNLSKDIERYSKLFSAHALIYEELERIVAEVEVKQDFPPALRKTFVDAWKRRSPIATEDDPKLNMRLARACQATVNRRWPKDRFWMPVTTLSPDTSMVP